MTSAQPRKVVLAPNLIGAALIDPSARRVLERWRDGEIIAVMSRELLSAHLRELNRIGLPPALIKRWGYWLSSPAKTDFIERPLPETCSPTALCENLASVSGAKQIVCWKLPNRKRAPWIAARDFAR